MAVKLGYKNVYRDPLGLPEWQSQGLPVASDPLGLCDYAPEAYAPGRLAGWAMVWTMLGIFVGGMALNLTPCVYPIIPITVSYFGGKSGQGQGRLLVHGLLYLAGLAVTNSALGVVAALTGGLMGALLQNPLVLVAVAAILVFFATSLFGFWELRLPGSLTQAASKSYAGYFGSLFMGLTLGVVAAPCIGPFVLGLLTWVASMGSPWLGFLVFFTLSLGLGLPLFILAIFSGSLEKTAPVGGVDALGAQTHGLGAPGHGRVFCPAPAAREPEPGARWPGWPWRRPSTWGGWTAPRPLSGVSRGSRPPWPWRG